MFLIREEKAKHEQRAEKELIDCGFDSVCCVALTLSIDSQHVNWFA